MTVYFSRGYYCISVAFCESFESNTLARSRLNSTTTCVAQALFSVEPFAPCSVTPSLSIEGRVLSVVLPLTIEHSTLAFGRLYCLLDVVTDDTDSSSSSKLSHSDSRHPPITTELSLFDSHLRAERRMLSSQQCHSMGFFAAVVSTVSCGGFMM